MKYGKKELEEKKLTDCEDSNNVQRTSCEGDDVHTTVKNPHIQTKTLSPTIHEYSEKLQLNNEQKIAFFEEKSPLPNNSETESSSANKLEHRNHQFEIFSTKPKNYFSISKIVSFPNSSLKLDGNSNSKSEPTTSLSTSTSLTSQCFKSEKPFDLSMKLKLDAFSENICKTKNVSTISNIIRSSPKPISTTSSTKSVWNPATYEPKPKKPTFETQFQKNLMLQQNFFQQNLEQQLNNPLYSLSRLRETQRLWCNNFNPMSNKFAPCPADTVITPSQPSLNEQHFLRQKSAEDLKNRSEKNDLRNSLLLSNFFNKNLQHLPQNPLSLEQMALLQNHFIKHRANNFENTTSPREDKSTSIDASPSQV